MKKLFVVFATAAFVLGVASCQKENLSGAIPAENTDSEQIDSTEDPMQSITVFVPSNDTKLSFSEGTIDNKTVILRKFSVDDAGQELFGCVKVDDKYEKFSYKIEDVEEVTGGVSMTLNKCFGKPGIPSNGEGTKVHFIYAPGHSCQSISDEGVLQLDLAEQNEGYIPAVMTATGVVGSDNKVTLNFTNQTSILAIVPPAEGSMLNDCNNTQAYSGCSFTSMKINALTKATLTFDETSGASVSDPVAGIAELRAKESWTESSTIYSTVFPGTCNIVATITGVKKGETDMGDFEYVPAGTVTVGSNAYLRIKKPFCHVAEARVEGDKKYDTFNAAMDAANAAEGAATVTLLRDCEVKKSTNVTNTAGVTLDLNGKTLKENGTNRFTLATSGATLTVKDSDSEGRGKILQTLTGSYTVQSTGGSLKIEGGEICSAETATASTVYFSSGAGDLTMSGGKIINTGNAYGVNFASSGSVSISGGYVTSLGSNALAASNGNVTVAGGFFASVGSSQIFNKGTNATFSVSSGYYSRAVADNLLQNGYSNHNSEEFEGYPFTVAPALTKVAVFQQQGGEPRDMATIRDAVAAANEATAPSTITLVADCVVSVDSENPAANITNSNKVTLDLNGHSLTQNGNSRLGVASTGTLLITDTGSDGRITQTSTALNTFSISSGTLEINGGLIEQPEGSTAAIVMVSDNGNLTISGGNIDSHGDGASALNFKGASLSITGGQINKTGENYAVRLSGNGTATIGGDAKINAEDFTAVYLDSSSECSLTVNGGTITSDGSNALYAYTGSTSKITISGGTLTGGTRAVYFSSTGNLNISDGTMTGTRAIDFSSTGKLNISGANTLIQGDTTAVYIHSRSADITGGTIKTTTTISGDNTNSKWGAIDIVGTSTNKVGTVNISNATVQNAKGWKAVYMYYGTQLNITSGTFSSARNVIYTGRYTSENYEVKISGGEMSSTGPYNTVYALCDGGKFEISGGKFKRTGSGTGNVGKGKNTTVSIIGGYFNLENDLNKYIPQGYTLKSDGASPYIYYVIKDETPSYPDTDKKPVKIGNIWWAPVNCGGDSELYTWNSAQSCCPSGWRTPTSGELQALANTGSSWSSNPAGYYFNSGTLFFLAAGYRRNGGDLENYGEYGYYWSSTEADSEHGIFLRFYYDHISVDNNDGNADKNRSCSVRCVKDAN